MTSTEAKPDTTSAAQSHDEPDLTMVSRRGSGEKLITSDTALEIARRVHTSVYGAADLALNEPLTITKSGNNWWVRGSKSAPPIEANQTLDGPLAMKISQFDGQILSYLFELRFKGGSG